MNNNQEYKSKKEYMISDIRTNSTSDMVSGKNSERTSLVVILTSVALFLWLIFVHGFIMRLLQVQGFFPKLILFIIFSIMVYIYSFETFVYRRKQKDKQTREIMSKDGDMISHFMKVKDIGVRNYGLKFNITVIEAVNFQVIPIEITYTKHDYYSRLIDNIIKNGITYQEYQLKGRISLFDKFRSYYSDFKGEELIKILDLIYRENEKQHKKSPSRRTYLLLNIGSTQDMEKVITSILRVSQCKIQFLNENMYKELVERYFGAPVNLAKMKANNQIRKISLEDTTIVESFTSEEELTNFIKLYKPNYVRPIGKFKIMGGGNGANARQRKTEKRNSSKFIR